MTEKQFKDLDNFGWNECDIHGRLLRDQLGRLNGMFMTRLDSAISDAKQLYGSVQGQFIVYDFVLDVHNPEGYHPRGRAIDGAFRGLDLFQTFLIFDWWRFGGIGIYPYTLPDKIVHVDDRDSYRALRWVRTKDGYIYLPEFFRKQLIAESLLSDK